MFEINPELNNFVCLDQITDHPEDLNYVIYNPDIWDKEYGKEILTKRISERFNVTLTHEDLELLFSYDGRHLSGFIQELKKIISIKK